MRDRRILFLAILFAAIQTVVAVHAGVYGDDPHTHAGEDCVVALAGDRADDDLTPRDAARIRHLPQLDARAETFASRALIVPTATVTPPGRAPPLA